MISVVIPAHDRRENVKLVLAGLQNQSLDKEKFEVIIADDASNDKLYELIDEFKEVLNLKYVRITKKVAWNASRPRNFGARVAEGDSYLFVDSDVVLNPGALKRYFNTVNQGFNDHILISRYDWLPPMEISKEDILERFEAFKSSDLLKKDLMRCGYVGPDIRAKNFEEKRDIYDQIYDGLSCFGGNLMIPRKIFWAVGGYDEDTHIGLEDGEMGIRLWKYGIREKKKIFKYMVGDATIGYHVAHEVPESRFPFNMRQHIERLNEKHFGNKDPDHGLIEKTRETFATYGIKDWKVPPEWERNES